ncbi:MULTISPECIES: hypothetical protein [Thiorhodovibrio]|uniref:hypothetical protein n=1 Tax=Thiorhodovibrio TaxID=61593 RepID=UPI001911592D|nr:MULTISPECIES: hypothetical protein [Thiorhodovibrio]MBK5968088.1 hypothetical protein [Thiorhodovibrio winogradskyi]WPL11754.1 hypothetical protein Thiosp_01506 [Thiorhodovibrio litoralis]
MPIEFKGNHALFLDIVTVEEAETLLEWLQKKPTAKVNLADCVHLHPANLQVLMAAKPVIKAWPKDAGLRSWLESALLE